MPGKKCQKPVKVGGDRRLGIAVAGSPHLLAYTYKNVVDASECLNPTNLL
jgi:hypothetical protein